MTNLFSCFNNNLIDILPLKNIINQTNIINDCDLFIRPQTEKGWTIDIVFDSTNHEWIDNSIFYYWGISGSTDPIEYLDNNLSFSFTSDNRIIWKTLKYINVNQSKLLTDLTPQLCQGSIINSQFNITITFERNMEIDINECLVDLITGSTVENPIQVLSGATPIISYGYGLTDKWTKNKKSRLGTLKIYLNGKPIYKLRNWEEIVPSVRNSDNNIIQSWGIGTNGIKNIHNGMCNFDILDVNYYEEPLNFIEINKLYQEKENKYSFTQCFDCDDLIVNI